MNKQLSQADFDGQSFLFGDHPVRVVVRDGKPWFCASDIATALGYKKPRDFYNLINAKRKGVANYGTLGGDQRMVAVNEAGTYEGVLRCRLPQAEPFVDWVTDDVLPTIRETGQYEHPTARLQADQSVVVEQLTHERDSAQAELAQIKHDLALKDELLTLYRERPAPSAPKPKRAAPKPLTAAEIHTIQTLKAQGLSHRQISERTGRSSSAISWVARGAKGGAK